MCVLQRCAVLLALMALGATAQELVTATNYRTDDGQQRTEATDGQGNVRGSYSYVDPNGKTITVRYTAGKDGFKVEGDHLPVAPKVPDVPAPVAPAAAAPTAPSWTPPAQQQWNQQPQAQQQQPKWAQPQPQWNQQPQQAAPQQWNQQPQQQWNQQPQQQQWTPPQQPQQQWNQQPQPQWAPPQQAQQPGSNAALQQLQNFPALNQPQNSLYQPQNTPSQGGQVTVSQNPGQGFSYTLNL
jgi:Insect cuticle protein